LSEIGHELLQTSCFPEQEIRADDSIRLGRLPRHPMRGGQRNEQGALEL
jgi:hypothetical protein